jgi:hypothetical protein
MKVEPITVVEQICLRQKPSKKWSPMRRVRAPETDVHWETWQNDCYYASVRRFADGFPIDDSEYIIIGITANDESAEHDWRDFQRIKNDIAGPEWEGVELYPAEFRLLDPSNRFYLWCVPNGVIRWGMIGRRDVRTPRKAIAPQRPFGEPWEYGE